MKKNILKKRIFILFLIIITTAILYYIYYQNYNKLKLETEAVFNDNKLEKEEATSNNTVTFYISGSVNKEGVYTLKAGSRVVDAIEIAGGSSEDADLENINLAEVIVEEQKISVPSLNTQIDEKLLVNINTATKEELMTLVGIGESTAEKIIDYRENIAKFNKIEDIMNVSGIGDKKFEVIKDYIRI